MLCVGKQYIVWKNFMDESGYVVLVNILFKNELIFFGVCYS